MGNTSWAGARYWDASEAASIPAATLALTQSVDDHWLGKFASTTDRNNALAAMDADKRPGTTAHVVGVGLTYFTGSAWKTLTSGTMSQGNVTSVTLEPNGLALISYPVPFGGLPKVCVSHATTTQAAPLRFVRLYFAATFLTSSFFHVHVLRPDGSPAGGEGIDIGWTAVGPIGAD